MVSVGRVLENDKLPLHYIIKPSKTYQTLKLGKFKKNTQHNTAKNALKTIFCVFLRSIMLAKNPFSPPNFVYVYEPKN